MILRELTVHNFGPFHGECTINLAPTRDDNTGPIVLVGALNGSGKTSLLDAVLLALYGSRARCSTRGSESYADFLRSCTNRLVQPQDGGSVRLSFQSHRAGGSVEIELFRRWRTSRGKTTEKLKVYRDGVADSVMSETWSEHVESLIPLGISNLFFFDGEQVRELAASSETTEDVQEAIRTLLGLELPERLQRDLEIVVRRRRKALVKPESLKEVSKAERRIRTIKHKAVAATNDHGELVRQRERVEGKLKKARAEFIAKGGSLAAQRVKIEAQIERLRQKAADMRDRLRLLAAGPLPLGLALGLVRSTREQAEREVETTVGAELVEVLTERDSELLSFLRSRRIAAKNLRATRDFLTRDRTERNGDDDSVSHLRVTRDMLRLFVDVEAQQLPRSRDEMRELCVELEKLEHRAEQLTRKLSGAAPQEVLAEQLPLLEDLETKLRDLLQREAELATKVEILQDQEKAENEQLGKMLRRLNDQQRDLDEGRRIIDAGERAHVVAERYKMALLGRKLLELERLIASRFRYLSRKRDFVDHISVHPETFNLMLYDKAGGEIDKRRMSAGEQQLLAVAFLWALGEASGRLLPLVIDTPLSRMDSQHRDQLVQGYFPHVSHQVILLSTDVEIDETYYQKLRDLNAIDRSYRIDYSDRDRSSTINDGYFWGA